MRRTVSMLLLALLALAARAETERNPVAARARGEPAVTRLIVGMKTDLFVRAQTQASASGEQAVAAGRVAALGVRSGAPLSWAHSIAPDTHVAVLGYPQRGALLAQTLASLRADAEVAYVAIDRRKYAHAVPNDPLYPSKPGLGQAGQTGQWYLQAPALTAAGGTTTTAAINATAAWDITTGSPNLVIALLDTGILFDHPDLMRVANGGRLLPGYDFVGPDEPTTNPPTYKTANNGHGWGPDPSDPGDWVTLADAADPYFSGCLVTPGVPEDSSWHGTRVAGIVGAIANNGQGVAGVSWGPKLLPLRVLGKCGGWDSDILAALRWAAGLSVPGVVDINPTPANVINMSFGSLTQCATAAGSPYPPVIDELTSRGIVIVASAGNEGGPVDEPANCAGVIAVTAVRHVGTKVGFANVSGIMTQGALPGVVAIAAPGGNCYNLNPPCLFPLDTTTDSGTMGPDTSATGYIYTDQSNPNLGTSFSAPLVAGVGALMLSVNSHLSPALVRARLASGARPFPNISLDQSGAPIPLCQTATSEADTSQGIECNCTTATCGAGLLDAPAALAEALRPIAVITAGGSTSNGGTVTLDASASTAADSHALATYAWAVTEHTTASVPTLAATSGAMSSLAIASCGDVTVQLTVTDDAGRADSTSATYGQAPATGSPCVAPSSGGGGGGGGALDPFSLALAAAGAALVAARRRRAPAPRS